MSWLSWIVVFISFFSYSFSSFVWSVFQKQHCNQLSFAYYISSSVVEFTCIKKKNYKNGAIFQSGSSTPLFLSPISQFWLAEEFHFIVIHSPKSSFGTAFPTAFALSPAFVLQKAGQARSALNLGSVNVSYIIIQRQLRFLNCMLDSTWYVS